MQAVVKFSDLSKEQIESRPSFQGLKLTEVLTIKTKVKVWRWAGDMECKVLTVH